MNDAYHMKQINRTPNDIYHNKIIQKRAYNNGLLSEKMHCKSMNLIIGK